MDNKRKAERLVRMLTDGYSGMKAVREVIELLGQWPDEPEAAPAAREPLTDEQIVWLVPGLLDCLCDPYDSIKNGDNYSSVPQDMVRLARAVEQFHDIGTPKEL